MNKAYRNNTLRIISGKWRGRKLSFPDIAGLRPTPDRIRETVFNWLAPYIRGANCLDLFAGSGALGLEALSRGANQVIFVDQHPVVISQLRYNLSQLVADNAYIIQTDARSPIAPLDTPYDIIFLDPPFHQNLLATCWQWLASDVYIHPQTIIYLESERELSIEFIPDNWQVHRRKVAGQIKFQLLQPKSGSSK